MTTLSRCPLCNLETAARCAEQHTVDGTTYSLFECTACGVQFFDPLKNPGAAWYEQDERYAGANAHPTGHANSHHRAILDLLAPAQGRVFDIGCGTGNFLRAAQEDGWEVAGIDFDRNAVRAAAELFALPNIEQGTLEEYLARHPEARSSYRLITFFDVLEHIDNHHVFMDMVSELLTPDGYIAMSMPYRYGSRWLLPHDLPPRHLTRWDEKSLPRFLSRAGYSVVECRRLPARFRDILMKIRFRYGRWASFNMVRRVSGPTAASGRTAPQVRTRVSLMRAAAIVKDTLLFGIPALIVWLLLLPTKKRYTGLYVVAKRTPSHASH